MSTDEPLALASEFPQPTYEEWRAAVDSAIKGADFERKLVTRTFDGLAIQPLYTPDDFDVSGDPMGVPGVAPYVRGAHGAGRHLTGWDIRQRHELAGDPAATNAALLDDLEGGVTSLVLAVDAATTPGDLEVALRGVHLDMAPVLLDPGAATGHGIDLVRHLIETSPSGSLVGLVGDPLGALARHGALDRHLADLQSSLAELVAGDPRAEARWVAADASVHHDAGASPAQELGAALACGVEWLRVLLAAGVDVDRACRAVEFTFAASADQFTTIAKLRAARWCWYRIATASGASSEAAGQRQHAVTSASMLTRRDPWVNMLRVTTACFAAGVAGADSVTVLPFDSAIGLPDGFGRRIARNTQLLLIEESQLARVADPAGGSHAVEAMTQDLAHAGWAFFQRIQAEGGMPAVLRSGWLAQQLDAAWAARMEAIATRREPITGVSEFPHLHEDPVVRPPRPAPAPVQAADTATPLPVRRAAEPYEALRDAAEQASEPPVVFLANLGPVATHTARAGFARNLFEAGGIRALGDEGFDSPVAAAAAFAESGARLAVICSSDELYERHGTATARALKDAGALAVYLAGNPGERRAEYEAAGVDEFIHVGCDVLATLRGAHARLGLGPTPGGAGGAPPDDTAETTRSGS